MNERINSFPNIREDTAQFNLARLERFARLASQAKLQGNLAQRQLADHAVLSAYRDCSALGMANEAIDTIAMSQHPEVDFKNESVLSPGRLGYAGRLVDRIYSSVRRLFGDYPPDKNP